MKIVLLVERERQLLQLWKEQLKEVEVHALTANSIAEGRELFLAHRGRLDLIAMGSRINTDDPDAAPLAAYFQEYEFSGPVIATSVNPEWRDQLRRAAPDLQWHYCQSKNALAKQILELLRS